MNAKDQYLKELKKQLTVSKKSQQEILHQMESMIEEHLEYNSNLTYEELVAEIGEIKQIADSFNQQEPEKIWTQKTVYKMIALFLVLILSLTLLYFHQSSKWPTKFDEEIIPLYEEEIIPTDLEE